MIPLTVADIDRLLMLITIANYKGDGELVAKLHEMRKRQAARETLNKNPT